MKNDNFRRCFIASLFFLCCIVNALPLQAQENTFKKKWIIKVAYGTTNDVLTWSSQSDYTYLTKPNFRMELNRRVCKNLELGGYLGYSKRYHYDFYYDLSNDDPYKIPLYSIHKKSNVFFYGMNLNYQLLPLFIEEKNLRFEVYATAKLGGVTEILQSKVPFIEYGVGLGSTFYITKHLGFFGEYSIGRYYNSSNNIGFPDDLMQARVGLSVKF